jgi:hypothetical protein
MYYKLLFQRFLLLNMIRGTHRSSSEAQKLYLQPLALHKSVVVCRQPQTYVKPQASNTVFEILMMSDVLLEIC